jgi:hypothetical protein
MYEAASKAGNTALRGFIMLLTHKTLALSAPPI